MLAHSDAFDGPDNPDVPNEKISDGNHSPMTFDLSLS